MPAEHPSGLSAAEAAKRIREGLLTSEELVEGCLERIRQTEPTVQAWAYLDEEYALRQARERDEHKSTAQPIGPLHGVPVGLKDIIDTTELPTENGTELHRGRWPREDAALVRMLKAAGAVILGKTVTTECAYFHPGKTRNPWNPEHTPGGSSSGSAAAVAASMVPLSVGSQTNGSVIRPGAFCGVYALKPTHGLIPRTGVLQLSRALDTMGVFARTLEDVALIAEVLAGYHEGDPDTRLRARVPFSETLAEEPPIPPMIGLVKTPFWDRASEETKAGFEEIAEVLGGQLEEVELGPSATEAWEWHKTIMEADMASSFEKEYLKGKDKLSPPLRALIERGRETRFVDYQRAMRGVRLLTDSLDDLFMERYDALITPAAPGSAPKGLASTGDPVFCSMWSLCGMPAVTLPLLQDAQGLPIGVQLVGRRNFDARLLRTARWLAGRLQA